MISERNKKMDAKEAIKTLEKLKENLSEEYPCSDNNSLSDEDINAFNISIETLKALEKVDKYETTDLGKDGRLIDIEKTFTTAKKEQKAVEKFLKHTMDPMFNRFLDENVLFGETLKILGIILFENNCSKEISQMHKEEIEFLRKRIFELELEKTENAKLKADADKWTDLMNKAGAVGLTEADFFKMVETVKEVMLGPEDGISCRGVFKS